MIVKKIHQIWIGNKPNPYFHLMKTWQEHHPDWEYCLWNKPISCQTQEMMNCAKSLASASTIMRIEILMTHGGIYVDADCKCLKNIEPLISNYERFISGRENRAISAIMGCNKNDEWMKWCYNQLPEYKNKSPGWDIELMQKSRQYFEIPFINSRFLHPFHWGIKRNHSLNEKDFPESYAIHFFDMSWKIN